MVVVKLSMFVLEGCKPPVDPNLQRGYRLYVQEKITMHTLSGTEIQKICASMEFEGNQFSTDIFVNTVTGEVLQRACSCKSLKCDNLCDHEAAALFKYVNGEWKENSPPKSPPESSGSGFWTIGLPIMAGVTAVAAAPLVLTAVGFTSAGIAAKSLAAGMMSKAAVANGGGVASRSLVAVLQSAGAAGIGTTGSALIGGTAAGVTAGGQAIAQKVRESVSQKKP